MEGMSDSEKVNTVYGYYYGSDKHEHEIARFYNTNFPEHKWGGCYREYAYPYDSPLDARYMLTRIMQEILPGDVLLTSDHVQFRTQFQNNLHNFLKSLSRKGAAFATVFPPCVWWPDDPLTQGLIAVAQEITADRFEKLVMKMEIPKTTKGRIIAAIVDDRVEYIRRRKNRTHQEYKDMLESLMPTSLRGYDAYLYRKTWEMRARRHLQRLKRAHKEKWDHFRGTIAMTPALVEQRNAERDELDKMTWWGVLKTVDFANDPNALTIEPKKAPFYQLNLQERRELIQQIESVQEDEIGS